MRLLTITAALSLGGFATLAAAQFQAQHHRPPYYPPQGHWQVIGNKTVNGARDSDVIDVPRRQPFRQVRLCASGGPLRLVSFNIRFFNGGQQDVRTRQIIDAGTCTRAVDLQGGARNIARIFLMYERVRPGFIAPRVQVSAR